MTISCRLRFILFLTLLSCLVCAAALADTLTLPRRLTVIDAEAFEDTDSLDEVMIPDGAKRIESKAFAGSGVQRVYLPGTLEYIAPDAFDGCAGMTAWGQYGTLAEEYCLDHDIPFEGAELDMSVFTIEFTSDTEAKITKYTGNDEVLYLPDMVDETHKITVIGERAFASNSTLKYIMLPADLQRIGKSAFSGCTKLEAIDFNARLQYIDENAFVSCSKLTELLLPDSVTYIGKNAFWVCNNLNYIHYPAFLTEVGEGVFAYCPKLTSVEITDGIMDFAPLFNQCSSLQKLVLPDTITVIPAKAFLGCSALTTIQINDGHETYGYEGEITLPPYLTTIETRAFEGCRSITQVNFNENLKRIESKAFNYCVSLGSALLPDSVYSLGMGAFTGCGELRAFHYPLSLSGGNQDNGVLEACPNLKYADVPDGVTYLVNIFRFCNGLESITLPESLKSMDARCFEGCTALKNVCIAGGRTHGEDECTVELPPSLKTLPGYSFSKCAGITKLECNSVLENINVGAFKDCTGLKEAVFNNSLKTIQHYAFQNCTALEEADVPAGTTTYPESFENCPLLN